MSASYDPQAIAVPVSPYTTVHLSSRDLADQLPINFVTRLGVSVTPACFGNGTYEESLAQTCVSNLLASTYRRLVLDLYWDSGLRHFSFCPVAIPPNSSVAPTTLTSVSSTAATANISSVVASRTTNANARRQATSLSLSGLSNSTTSSVIAASTPAPVRTTTAASGRTLYELGPYQCTESINLQFFLSLFLDYLQNTSDTIQVNLLFISLNLHAAASPDAPNEPAETPTGGSLPSPKELLGSGASGFSHVISPYIYEPTDLDTDRNNLNDSWFSVPDSRQPIAEYLTMETAEDGALSTSDGWPCEIYLLVSRARRVLVGWNNIDPQMQNYNFTGDQEIVFAPGTFSAPRLVTSSSTGKITSGCFFDPAKASLSQIDSSWALSSVANVDDVPDFANNLTSCGISAVLNETLSNSPANFDGEVYRLFAETTVWSWAAGEPRNYSDASDDDNPNSQFRCAVMDFTKPYLGKWRVEDCSKRFRTACRVDNQPYVWQLSSTEVSFSTGPESCSGNSSFAVPRTGLESSYLYQHVNSNLRRSDPDDSGPSQIWLNFNSLDVEGCWVATGPNGTCTYYAIAEDIRQRKVLVPAIAALIVLILTALTVFVKCNSNRRMSRRRKRRGEGGWDYEGVPA